MPKKKNPLLDEETPKTPEVSEEVKAPKVSKKAKAPKETKEEAAKPEPKVALTPEQQYQKQLDDAKAKLLAGPHVTYIIPLAEGEKVGATDFVSLNGYEMHIEKNVPVSIPVPIAEILMEKYRVRATAGREKLMDRSEKIQAALE